MNTHDEFKKALECCIRARRGTCAHTCGSCDMYVNGPFSTIFADGIRYIQQLEANWSQVSKTLCGKENVTLDEVLQAINQEKTSSYALPARSGKTLTVRHGKWRLSSVEPRSVRFDEKIVCSVCRGTHPRFTGVWYKYCPNCGAEMDGVRNPLDALTKTPKENNNA